MTTITIGADGRARCGWVGSDPGPEIGLYARYHDEEWGRPLHGDQALFEKICLEGFQAGLSWITILRRRPGFREAFLGFEPAAVAALGPDDVERLMLDTGIIRNRAKIEATIGNARALLTLQAADGEGALDRLVWAHTPSPDRAGGERGSSAPEARIETSKGARPRTFAELPAATTESTALSKSLKRLGFRFVGPTTMYALMQSAGLVDDHLEGCWRAG
ncbi:MAG TPA: DNA-3-methyladenine glycosylase I [Microbacteriaceae bacterium]|nr:DNA-3-methyladenine glycosylase I [Microbacteriaceae bacterium]